MVAPVNLERFLRARAAFSPYICDLARHSVQRGTQRAGDETTLRLHVPDRPIFPFGSAQPVDGTQPGFSKIQ